MTEYPRWETDKTTGLEICYLSATARVWFKGTDRKYELRSGPDGEWFAPYAPDAAWVAGGIAATQKRYDDIPSSFDIASALTQLAATEPGNDEERLLLSVQLQTGWALLRLRMEQDKYRP